MLRPLLLAILLCFPGIPVSAYQLSLSSPWENPSDILDDRISGVYTLESNGAHSRKIFTPIVSNSIPDQTRSITAGSFTLDLNEVFSETDGNALTFSASSNNKDIAVTSIDGSMLTVTPLAIGNCRIRATARDGNNRKADDTFTLTIKSNQPPALAPEATLEHQVLFTGGVSLVLNLSTLFLDPDGDNLIYSAASEHDEIALTSVDQEILTVTPNLVGETTITLSVSDQNGGILLESFTLEVQRGYSATLAVETHVEFEDHRDQGNYRMIALPGNQSLLVANTTTGNPNEDWVAYAPDTTNSGRLIPYTRSSSFVLTPGRGLWFLSKEDWVQPLRTVQSVPLDSDGTFKIPLHKGWNIISNPLDQDIPWPVIAQYNDVSQNIWRWNHGYRQIDTFYSTVNIQEAYYFNNAEGLESLSLPYAFASLTGKKPGAYHNSKEQRIVKAVATASGQTAVVTLNLNQDATLGFDRHDQLAPPTHFAELALSIVPNHPDFEDETLAVESRPIIEPVHRFELELNSTSHETVFFHLDGINLLADETAILVNLLDAKTFKLDTSVPQVLQLDASTTPFSLFIGKRSEIDRELEQLSPALFSLKQNYPNPFSPQTTIEYSLPSSQTVDLSVYDIMGRHIITLQQGEREAGFHRIQWNGYDQNRHKVANGVYFYRLQAGPWMQSHKMTLVR